MPIRAPRLTLVLLALSIGFGACGDGSTVPVAPSGPGTLIPGAWRMNLANGAALPATISTRTVGVAQETTVLDSARIVILGNGSWEQRYYLSISITGVLDRVEVVLDEGSWSASATGFAFLSSVRPRSFTATFPTVGAMSTSEPMLFYVGAQAVAGSYRLGS